MILPAGTAKAAAFLRHFEAVWVHGRHDVNSCVVQQPLDVRLAVVVKYEVLAEKKSGRGYFRGWKVQCPQIILNSC